MIISIFSLLLFLIFMVLSGFHFYWLFGGTWGVNSVIPTKDNDTSALSPPKFATLVVALGLASFGGVYLIQSGFVRFTLPNWVEYAYWGIPVIFTLRAIGEFNYVGFFKKIKHTEFAKADSKLFSPLCLGIGIVGFLIQWV